MPIDQNTAEHNRTDDNAKNKANSNTDQFNSSDRNPSRERVVAAYNAQDKGASQLSQMGFPSPDSLMEKGVHPSINYNPGPEPNAGRDYTPDVQVDPRINFNPGPEPNKGSDYTLERSSTPQINYNPGPEPNAGRDYTPDAQVTFSNPGPKPVEGSEVTPEHGKGVPSLH